MTQNEQAPAAIAEEADAGRLEWIDPLTDFRPDEPEESRVIVDPFNHRKKREDGEEDTTEPDPGLIASVDAVGVQQAPVLRPQVGANEGKLGIVMGQRRMKAARAAAEKAVAEGRKYRKVRVIIREDLKGVDDEALAGSMVENVHRAAASVQDDLDAAQQLALMVDAKRVPKARKAQLAAAIGRTTEELDAAPRVAKIAPEVIEELWEQGAEFDWVEQADYAEVEDVPNALWKLEQAKRKDADEGNTKRGAWRQAMQALRAEKEKAERIAATTAELAKKMIPVIGWPHSWQYSAARPLEELESAIGRPLTEAGHNETCEGHAATFDPADGEVVWVCRDFKKHGHRIIGAAQNEDDGSEEADEKAEAEREAARAEARRVKANNAAWRSVREVRQAFIVDMCQDKGEAPADVKDLVLTTILAGRYTYTHYVTGDYGRLLSTFLKDENLKHTPADVVAKLVKRTGAKRYWWLLFAHVAGMYEFEHMTDEAWRGKKDEFGRRKPIEGETVEWLNFLKKHGYSLSEVEEETLATAQQQAEEEARRVAERKERDARWQREREEARLKREAEEKAAREAEAVQADESHEPEDEPDTEPAEADDE
ncbi:ParB/RepB/Spo0J family partition protein [Streptomyces griseorubiginosus]|uniref:ParB/RepB/Spo0J family partition protein n=1 Tax=Streptomyces griseorubiginosus TaxID=67304 RepID=UPI002E7FFBB2|nr:ParB N-terminal domain-containing protein [Streptomyces griseorubiginosus]WUB58903.1 ParB N-terminal domain-containing protein [Streptomyces griseorubiginosus]